MGECDNSLDTFHGSGHEHQGREDPVSEQLDHPPVLADLSEAEARFRQWMHANLSHTADYFGLTVAGKTRLGWLDRRRFPDRNLDADVFATLPKPQVLDVYEWEEWRQQRAELMTLTPGAPCSRTDALRHAIDLSDQWWTELRSAIEMNSVGFAGPDEPYTLAIMNDLRGRAATPRAALRDTEITRILFR